MSKSQRIDIPLVGGKNDDIPEELLPPGQFVTADGGYFTQQGELRRFNETVSSTTGVISDGTYLYSDITVDINGDGIPDVLGFSSVNYQGATTPQNDITTIGSANSFPYAPLWVTTGTLVLSVTNNLDNSIQVDLIESTNKTSIAHAIYSGRIGLVAGYKTGSNAAFYIGSRMSATGYMNILKITAAGAFTEYTTTTAITTAAFVNAKELQAFYFYGFTNAAQYRFSLTGAVEQTGAIALIGAAGNVLCCASIGDGSSSTNPAACFLLAEIDALSDTYTEIIRDLGGAFSLVIGSTQQLSTTGTPTMLVGADVQEGGAAFEDASGGPLGALIQTRSLVENPRTYYVSANTSVVNSRASSYIDLTNYLLTQNLLAVYAYSRGGNDDGSMANMEVVTSDGSITTDSTTASFFASARVGVLSGSAYSTHGVGLIRKCVPYYRGGRLPVSISSINNGVSFAYPGPPVLHIAITKQLEQEFPIAYFTESLVPLESKTQVQAFHRTLYLSGGALRHTDRGEILEVGFISPPQSFTLSQSTAAGALTTTGVYKYKLAYRSVLYTNRIEYSEPSSTQTITLTGTNNTVTIALPPPIVTNKSWVYRDVFRTEAGGNVYYFAGSQLLNGYGNTFVDTLADSTLITNPVLYTETGELANVPPGVADSLAVFDNRLWCLSSSDGYVTYSQEPQEGKLLTFSDEYFIDCNKDAGQPYVLAGLEQMLLIGCANGILRLYGSGPSLDGQGGSYSVPAKFIGGVQCIQGSPAYSHGSWAIFDTTSGLVKVNIKGEVDYIGKAIRETTGASPLVDIFAEPDRDVIWCLINGVFYLYNYRLNVWTTLTLSDTVVRAGLHNNQLVYQYSNSGGGYKTGANSTYLTLKTGWLNLNGIEGFYRLKRIYVKIDDQSAGNANKYAHVYTQAPGFSQEDYNVNETTLLQPYFRVHPLHQKADRIQLQVKVGVTSGTAEGYRLQGLSLEWAPKPKLPR